MSEEEGREHLLSSVEGEVLTDPRVIRFRTGTRRAHWARNCVAIGLSSGFIEPLESTSIHLIQRSVVRLLMMFPQNGISQTDVDEFNQQTFYELEHIRDFIILHYHLTNRTDTEFWRHVKTMEIPETLRHRMEMFEETGRVFRANDQLFAENSWTQVMLGQGLMPKSHHPTADVLDTGEVDRFLKHIKDNVDKTVSMLPKHASYLGSYCPSEIPAKTA